MDVGISSEKKRFDRRTRFISLLRLYVWITGVLLGPIKCHGYPVYATNQDNANTKPPKSFNNIMTYIDLLGVL